MPPLAQSPRRSAAIGLALLLALSIGAAGVATAPPTADASEYVVLQGDRCVPVAPIANESQSVEEFYDYRSPETDPSAYTYSSYGTAHLQADNTSVLFLYEGREGTSLLLINGHLDGDGDGGAATVQIDGLPDGGEWVIEDDSYADHLGDGPYDEFDHDGSSSRITWAWNDGRNDGAAFRGGLDGDFEITVDPAFNDAADFRIYEGTIDDWQVVSATDDGIERTSLDTSEPASIRPGPCTSFAVSELRVPGDVEAGAAVDVTATVANDGATAGTFDVPFTVDGEVVDERAVSVEPGESAAVTTAIEFEEAGTHDVGAGGATATVTVEAPSEDTDAGGPGGDTDTGGSQSDADTDGPGDGRDGDGSQGATDADEGGTDGAGATLDDGSDVDTDSGDADGEGSDADSDRSDAGSEPDGAGNGSGDDRSTPGFGLIAAAAAVAAAALLLRRGR